MSTANIRHLDAADESYRAAQLGEAIHACASAFMPRTAQADRATLRIA